MLYHFSKPILRSASLLRGTNRKAQAFWISPLSTAIPATENQHVYDHRISCCEKPLFIRNNGLGILLELGIQRLLAPKYPSDCKTAIPSYTTRKRKALSEKLLHVLERQSFKSEPADLPSHPVEGHGKPYKNHFVVRNDPTTGYLTATVFAYAVGDWITAAICTVLALQ